MARLSRWLRNPWVWSMAFLLGAVVYRVAMLDAQEPNSGAIAAKEDALVIVSAANSTNESERYAPLAQQQSALDWEPFNEPRLQQLVSQGKMVMVHFTADWCVNGKRNLDLALHTPKVRDAVAKNQVISMTSDLTQQPSVFWDKLKTELDSVSLPLLAIYRPSQPNQPVLLRDLFTESDVLKGLEPASASLTAGDGRGEDPLFTWIKPQGPKPDWLIRGENAIRAREKVRRKLDVSTEIQLNAQPLGSVLMVLSDTYGFPIHSNPKSLEQAAVTLEEPITLSTTASLRAVLPRILHPLNLDYIVLEEGLEITTRTDAILHGAVLSYNLATLTNSSSEGDRIVDTIKKMIQPNAWVENGGEASCQLIGLVLLVKASEGMHEEIQNLLAQLDATRPDDAK